MVTLGRTRTSDPDHVVTKTRRGKESGKPAHQQQLSLLEHHSNQVLQRDQHLRLRPSLGMD
jgi:hypothetical protein